MQMGVTISENQEELFGEKRCAGEHDCAEDDHAASDRGVKKAQLRFILTTRECRHENIREHVHQDGENHGETSESADFSNRGGLAREKTDEEDGDLSLETIKDRVGGQAFDQANDFLSVFGIFIRL